MKQSNANTGPSNLVQRWRVHYHNLRNESKPQINRHFDKDK